MADRYDTIEQIGKTIDDAVSSFNKSIPNIEKSLSDDIALIIKDLDVGNDGKIKTSVKNLRKMREINRRMASAFESDAYLKQVNEFTDSFDAVQKLEQNYFEITLAEFTQPSVVPAITQQAITSVTNELTGSNIVANVIDPVNTLVRQGIESGLQWDDLRSSINTFLRGQDGGTGALTRYTTTITNDSLHTYARTYENLVADREGIEWFEYVGREQTDTREFCLVLDGFRWFKRSDIPDLIGGKIKSYQSGKTKSVPLYKKTGKPYGMKASTTPGNFIQLCGGWNCGHHAYPVPDHLVPDNIKNGKVDGGVETPKVSEFIPATTTQDAQKFAMDNGLVINANYRGLSLESANALNKSLVGLQKKTGMQPINNVGELQILKELHLTTKISRRTRQGTVGQYSSRHDIGSIKPTQEALVLNKNKLGTLKDADNTFEALKKNGQIHNMDFDGAIAHEYGHFVDAHNSTSEWSSISDDLWNDVVRKETEDATGLQIFKQQVNDKVGSYALTNNKEFFAEMFRLSYQKKMPKEFDFIDKWFNENIFK